MNTQIRGLLLQPWVNLSQLERAAGIPRGSLWLWIHDRRPIAPDKLNKVREILSCLNDLDLNR